MYAIFSDIYIKSNSMKAKFNSKKKLIAQKNIEYI